MLKFLSTRNEVKARDVEALLDQIPASIDDAYTKLLERSQDPPRARRLLHYVLGAARELTLAEMNILMNIDEDCDSGADIELWPDAVTETRVKNICGLFVVIVESKIYLIHQTARE